MQETISIPQDYSHLEIEDSSTTGVKAQTPHKVKEPSPSSSSSTSSSSSSVVGRVSPKPGHSSPPPPRAIRRDDLWVTDRDLGSGPVRLMDPSETLFWRKLIKKYLYPIDQDRTHEAKIRKDLKTLRNNAVFLFFMLNFLWLFIIFLLQIVQDQLQDTLYIRVPKRGGTDEKHFEPLSVAFLVFFALIILIQFVSMLFHRYGTFLHILASTGLRCCSKQYEPIAIEDIVQTVKVLQQIKGIIDDDDDDDDNDDEDDDDADPDYDMMGERGDPDHDGDPGGQVNPDVVSCGAESVRHRKSQHYSSKTLRGAFVKRYNALSKRSTKNKSQRRPGLKQVFDNASYQERI